MGGQFKGSVPCPWSFPQARIRIVPELTFGLSSELSRSAGRASGWPAQGVDAVCPALFSNLYSKLSFDLSPELSSVVMRGYLWPAQCLGAVSCDLSAELFLELLPEMSFELSPE